MTKETIPELLSAWPAVRKYACWIQDARKRQKHALRRSLSKHTPLEPQRSKKGNPIPSRDQWREESERLWAEHQKVEFGCREHFFSQRKKLRAFLISEVGRLEDVVGDMDDRMISEAWRQIYLIRAAALMAWDGKSLEIEAGIAKFMETSTFRELSRLHNKRRTRGRLENGYWDKPALKKARREASRDRRDAMSDEERKSESEARAERRRRKKAREKRQVQTYTGILDEEQMRKAS